MVSRANRLQCWRVFRFRFSTYLVETFAISGRPISESLSLLPLKVAMYFAYFDESGDPGPLPASPTAFYVVACVLVNDRVWRENLEFLVKVRRRLRTRWGISMRPEIKATDIRRARGPLAHLHWSQSQRADFY